MTLHEAIAAAERDYPGETITRYGWVSAAQDVYVLTTAGGMCVRVHDGAASLENMAALIAETDQMRTFGTPPSTGVAEPRALL